MSKCCGRQSATEQSDEYIEGALKQSYAISNLTPDTGGKKLDAGKPGMDLLPHDALVEIAKVLDFGKQKYDAHNWKKGIKYSRVLAAALRHIGEYNEGRRTDPETGLSHAAHAACNLLFLLWYEKHRPEMDDLYTEEEK